MNSIESAVLMVLSILTFIVIGSDAEEECLSKSGDLFFFVLINHVN